jgi:D-xylose transport system substrate-binding protein
MKKIVSVVVISALLVLMLAGCSKGSDNAGDVKKIKIGVSFATEIAARFQFDERYMRETAESLGAELLVQWANYEQARQESQVENLITQDIDVLILVAVSTNMAPLVEKVKAEGIPVVCYDNFIENAPLDAYLDRDNQEAGRIQMKAAMEAIGGKGNIAIIHGEPTSAVVQGMRVGYFDVLAGYPDVKVVTEQYCEGYSAEKALRIAENTLSANNDNVDAFICTSDVLTLGILPAVEAAGLSGKAFLTGMDCEVAAMQAVDKGYIGIDIWTEIDKCAIRAAEIAYALATGREFEYDNMVTNGNFRVPKIFVPILGVTKGNMEQWVNTVAPDGWITMKDIRG